MFIKLIYNSIKTSSMAVSSNLVPLEFLILVLVRLDEIASFLIAISIIFLCRPKKKIKNNSNNKTVMCESRLTSVVLGDCFSSLFRVFTYQISYNILTYKHDEFI